jgi:hypothetical protein
MRVTKIIKEYIGKKVNEVYEPKMNEIGLQYKCDREKMAMRIKSAVLECEEKIKAIVADHQDGWNYECKRYHTFACGTEWLRYCEPIDEEAEKKFYQEKQNLIDEKNEKIQEIIVALELGGDKAMLDEMLKNL